MESNGASGGLQREIRQTKPFRSPEHEALLALLRTADLVRRSLAAVIEPHGITLQQHNVLRILRGAGSKLPTLDIAGRMIEQTPGITRLLDRLEMKGLVRRERCPEDRRQVLCWITESGLELVSRLEASVDAVHQAAFLRLEPPQVQQLIAALDGVRAVLKSSEEVANAAQAGADR